MDENTPKRALRLSTNLLIVILIIVSLISFLSIGGYYLLSRKSAPSAALANLTPTPPAKPGDPSTYALPLPFGHPNVANGKFYYNIGGDVRTISGDRITLTSKDPKSDLPPFPITAETKYVFGDSTPATLADVIVGKFVYVSAIYDLSTRSWSVDTITTYK